MPKQSKDITCPSGALKQFLKSIMKVWHKLKSFLNGNKWMHTISEMMNSWERNIDVNMNFSPTSMFHFDVPLALWINRSISKERPRQEAMSEFVPVIPAPMKKNPSNINIVIHSKRKSWFVICRCLRYFWLGLLEHMILYRAMKNPPRTHLILTKAAKKATIQQILSPNSSLTGVLITSDETRKKSITG